MGTPPNASGSHPDTGSVGDLLHIVVVLILSALPPAAATAFPTDVLEDKNQTFITLYFLTLPWSLAVSLIVAGLAGGWFGPDDRNQVGAVAGILFVSALVGGAIAPGSPFDEQFRGAPPWFMVLEIIFFVVIGYALVYGWPMWLAAFLVAAYVGWWAHEKLERGEQALAGSGDSALTANTDRSERTATPTEVPSPTQQWNVVPRPLLQQHAAGSTQPDGLERLTKDELYQQARLEGIPGRSTMSKDQLLAALRARRG